MRKNLQNVKIQIIFTIKDCENTIIVASKKRMNEAKNTIFGRYNRI